MPEQYEIRLLDGNTRIWQVFVGTADPEEDNPVTLAQVSTMTATLRDTAGTVVNGRAVQNVLNANNFTFHATSGLLTWSIRQADTTLLVAANNSDIHRLTIVITLTDAQRITRYVDLYIARVAEDA